MGRFCSNCGIELMENELFCPACGTKIVQQAPKEVVCPVCSAKLEKEEMYCLSCGIQVIPNEGKKEKRLFVRIGLLVLLSIIIANLLFNFLATPKMLITMGDYQRAYYRAPITERGDIYRENCVAYATKLYMDKKDSECSFKVHAAWIELGGMYGKNIVLWVEENRERTTVFKYYLYSYLGEYGTWVLQAKTTDADYENLTESSKKKMMVTAWNSSTALPIDAIQNINRLNKIHRLDNVELIEID